jgi:hypothetical protein
VRTLSRFVALVTLGLVGVQAAGCIDFDAEVDAFCRDNPTCGSSGGGDKGDGGPSDMEPDAGSTRVPQWVPVSPMASVRFGHTATLLKSGKVLVVGGFNDWDNAVATAEVYDPETDTWTDAGTLAHARGDHTATLLPSSGLVLVVGGRHQNTPLDTAELYNPSTGKWGDAGTLAGARASHAAVLLPSGKVLVVGGGDGPSTGLVTSELYNPTTGSWTDAGTLPTARNTLTATLLDGSVLAVGGYNGNGALRSADEYRLSTGTWTAAAGLLTAQPRSSHTATLLPSGRLLVTGSLIDPSKRVVSNTAEVYDPGLGRWMDAGTMSSPRSEHTATLLPSGEVLVAGGNPEQDESLASVDVYVPGTGRWTSAPSMLVARAQHEATVLDGGAVLVTGGIGNNGHLNTVEKYIP